MISKTIRFEETEVEKADAIAEIYNLIEGMNIFDFSSVIRKGLNHLYDSIDSEWLNSDRKRLLSFLKNTFEDKDSRQHVSKCADVLKISDKEAEKLLKILSVLGYVNAYDHLGRFYRITEKGYIIVKDVD